MNIAKFEIRQSNRRTLLGPWWITLQIVIWLFSITFIYANLFGISESSYINYLCTGLLAWTWVSAILSEGGNIFIENRALIHNTKINKFILVSSAAFRLFIIFIYQIPVYIILNLLGFGNINKNLLYLVPNSCILFFISINIIGINAYLFSRFRDLPKLIGASMTMLLMLTPVFWPASQLSESRKFIITYNPLNYLIDLIRMPLLGIPTPLLNYYVTIGMLVISAIVLFLIAKNYFNKIIQLV